MRFPHFLPFSDTWLRPPKGQGQPQVKWTWGLPVWGPWATWVRTWPWAGRSQAMSHKANHLFCFFFGPQVGVEASSIKR